jgi:uncharacterized membrane protein
MATLSVWRFPSAEGAVAAQDKLLELQGQELIRVEDAAVVSWRDGAKKPKTEQLNGLAGAGALGGGFWGMLFGLLFFVPLLGAAIGAAAGALTGALADVGIDDDFIKKVKDDVTPGTSALFVLTSHAVVERVAAAFQGDRAELIQTSLSEQDEANLRAAFADD